MSLTEEQLTLRKTGVTGSEVAALLGLSKYISPIDVYTSKVEPQAGGDFGSWRAMVGTVLEQHIANWYANMFGKRIDFPGTLVHPNNPRIIATPDGIVRNEGLGPDMILEIKVPGIRTSWHWGEPGSDEIPDYYYPQVIWELAVTGLQTAHVVAELGNAQPDIFTVQFDADLFGEMETIVNEFWRDHVIPRVPPEPDGSNAYGDFLKRTLAQKQKAALITPTPEIDRVAREVYALRDESSRIKQEIEVREQAIKAFIGEELGIEGGFGRVTWKAPNDGSKIDWQAVAKALGAEQALIDQHTAVVKNSRRMHYGDPSKPKGKKKKE